MSNNLAVSSSKEILETMDNCTKCSICYSFCPVANVTKEFPGPKYTGPQTQQSSGASTQPESPSTQIAAS